MKEFPKDPSAVLDYVFDWSKWLAFDETISSKTITVDTGLSLVSSAATDSTVTVWLSGGSVRETYKVACLVTTSAGRTDERTMLIKVMNR